jgi:hypothetical protein
MKIFKFQTVKRLGIIGSLSLGSVLAFSSLTPAFAQIPDRYSEICDQTFPLDIDVDIDGVDFKFLVGSGFGEAVVCTGFYDSIDEVSSLLELRNPGVALIGSIGFDTQFGLPDFVNPAAVGIFDEVFFEISSPWEFEGGLAESPQSITIPWYIPHAESQAETKVTIGPGGLGQIGESGGGTLPVLIEIEGIDATFFGDIATSAVPTPEPTNILGSMTVLGLGIWLKKQKS